MKGHQRISSIFWIVLGMYVAIHAYRLGIGHFRQPGPGLIFFLAALFIIILGIFDLAGGFIKIFKTDEEKPIWSGVQWPNVLIILAILLIYVFVLNVLGFILSTFLLMLSLFKAIEPTRWWVAIVSSIITTLLSYGIFEIWLKVPFPHGFLGF